MLLLYQRADEAIPPHEGHTVADFTCQISDWRNRMSRCGAKDEGLKVLDRRQGAEQHTISNILGAGEDSLGSHSCIRPRKGGEKKKEPRAKSSFHSCSLTSKPKNKYFNIFGILQQILHKIEYLSANQFIFTIRWQSNLTFNVGKQI